MDCLRGCKWKDHHLADCRDSNCWGCAVRKTDGFKVCSKCVQRLHEGFVGIVKLWPALMEQHIRPDSPALRERVSGSHEFRLPINTVVLDAEAELRDWLLFVARIIVSENEGFHGPDDLSNIGLVRYVAGHEKFLLGHELAVDFVEEVSKFRARLSSVAYPVKSVAIEIDQGFCDVELKDGAICGGQLYAVLKSDTDTLPEFIKCRKDKSHNLPATAWKGLGRGLLALAQNR